MAWIAGNRYLSQSEMDNNALIAAQILLEFGWTHNAIAGTLGNMQYESNINPGLWENLNEGNTSNGFGLTQWTPATKLINWCNSKGLNYKDGNAQLQRLQYEVEWDTQSPNQGQWINRDGLSFAEYIKSTDTPTNLARVFIRSYERPANENQPQRETAAERYFNLIKDLVGGKLEKVIEAIMGRTVEYNGHKGLNLYSQDAVLRTQVFNLPTGHSDCSSLMWKAFEIYGDTFIGTWTEEQRTHGELVWTNTNPDWHTVHLEEQSKIMRGDLIFYGTLGGQSEHVEMFLGDNQQVGHGSGWGPTLKVTSNYRHPYPVMEVRRYLYGGGIIPPTTPLWKKYLGGIVKNRRKKQCKQVILLN